MDIDALKKLGSVKRLNENEYIFCEGDNSKEIYIVLSGKIGLYLCSQNGFLIKVFELIKGDFFGENYILENLPRFYTAIALTDSIVISMEKENFEEFLNIEPCFALKMLKTMSFRFRVLCYKLSKSAKLENDIDLAINPISKLNLDIGKCLNDNMIGENSNTNTELDGKTKDISKTEENEDREGIKCENEEKNKTGLFVHSINVSEIDKLLFPEGHKKYDGKMIEDHKKYLYEKKVLCPMCEYNFSVLAPKQSKIRLDKVDNDFRKRYYDFEPIWYYVWVCPSCYYTNHTSFFDKMSNASKKYITERCITLKDNLKFSYSEYRTINEIFTAYYMALFCNDYPGTNKLNIGKLWMHISWLYDDVKDIEMYEYACKEAYKKYHEAFYNESKSFTVEQEQQCCLILGELLMKQKNVKEAAIYFQMAIKRNAGSDSLNKQAEERLIEIREKNLLTT